MSASDERYAFMAEWYDPQAALMRKYQLLYYPSDSTVEMYDIKNRRLFLKRSVIDGLRTPDLYIGAIVNIHSRQLTITDFADNFTTSRLKSINEQTLALIKPDALGAGHLGSIVEMIDKEGFVICKAKMVRLTRQEASDFYKEHANQPFYNRLVEFMTSGPVVAMELKGHDAIQRWRKLLGPTDSATAREKSPISVRAKFGTDNTKNAAHGSDSSVSAEKELKFFFGYKRQNTAQFNNCTLCIIKPHAVAEGLTGKIISAILDQGFEVSALQMYHMERANAEEFHEVYKGVVNEYNSMVVELCSGPCLVLEIRGLDAPQKFREFVGPADPEIARHLRPRTIRARFGKDKIKNAVHCTDLPEDGILEVQYFFKILNQ
ncbi:nucleoside diphosphate kinase 7-like [Actinia tenebrosa]|uniref:Nucleoside diphosphate kinase 7-like n=1 Tax=Actinia tenebrosa TaxID=6105 RepID=A0A6P8H8I4_ACTTE|nr:nucleoside diphosphate kinase 7-like [Actinia tenebrosa]